MGKNSKSIIKKQLNKIIEGKKVYPVYQPIVSLKTGEIMGYEALSRICLEPCDFNVEEMFSYTSAFGISKRHAHKVFIKCPVSKLRLRLQTVETGHYFCSLMPLRNARKPR